MSKIIIIDAGHGGSDPGAIGNGLKEKDLTLDISKRIKKLLSGHDCKVVMTRTNDKYLTLTQRTDIANKAKADLFLSVHINAGGGTGFESFIYNGTVSNATKQYQKTLHKAIMGEIDVRDRGEKTANLAVVRQSKMPAVLTEVLFIDTKADADKLKDSKFLDSVAKGHADGIVEHLKLKKTNTSTTNKKPSKPVSKPKKKPSTPSKPSTKGDMKTTSIVVYLQSIKQPFSYAHRAKLAKQHGINGYKGTSVQNLMLLDKLRKGETTTVSKPKQTVEKKTISQMATEVINSSKMPKGHEARRKYFGISKAEYEKVRKEVNRRLR